MNVFQKWYGKLLYSLNVAKFSIREFDNCSWLNCYFIYENHVAINSGTGLSITLKKLHVNKNFVITIDPIDCKDNATILTTKAMCRFVLSCTYYSVQTYNNIFFF